MDNGASSYRRFLNGDDNAISEIVGDYKDGLILYLNGYVKNIFIAEELAEATFFGITIHAEKELLMMVVEKDIRDNVLHALYKQMGMKQKAQGIVFSLPVSDVAGLAQPNDEKEL